MLREGEKINFPTLEKFTFWCQHTPDVVMRRILKHIEDYQCHHKFKLMLMLLLDNFITKEGDFHKELC